MTAFDPNAYGPAIAPLLAPERVAPLGPGTPNEQARPLLEGLTAEAAFAHARVANRAMAQACLAGLWLYHDVLDASHTISQGVQNAEGSYWHGIMHRREPDYSNAKHWFRRVGDHTIFPDLAAAARDLAAAAGPAANAAFLAQQKTWDPFAFIDLCEAAAAPGASAHELCRRIQHAEWRILFDFCYRHALGAGDR